MLYTRAYMWFRVSPAGKPSDRDDHKSMKSRWWVIRKSARDCLLLYSSPGPLRHWHRGDTQAAHMRGCTCTRRTHAHTRARTRTGAHMEPFARTIAFVFPLARFRWPSPSFPSVFASLPSAFFSSLPRLCFNLPRPSRDTLFITASPAPSFFPSSLTPTSPPASAVCFHLPLPLFHPFTVFPFHPLSLRATVLYPTRGSLLSGFY